MILVGYIIGSTMMYYTIKSFKYVLFAIIAS